MKWIELNYDLIYPFSQFATVVSCSCSYSVRYRICVFAKANDKTTFRTCHQRANRRYTYWSRAGSSSSFIPRIAIPNHNTHASHYWCAERVNAPIMNSSGLAAVLLCILKLQPYGRRMRPESVGVCLFKFYCLVHSLWPARVHWTYA